MGPSLPGAGGLHIAGLGAGEAYNNRNRKWVGRRRNWVGPPLFSEPHYPNSTVLSLVKLLDCGYVETILP